MAKRFDTTTTGIETANVISLPKVYKRLEGQPIDPSMVFGTVDDAKKYAYGNASDPDTRGMFGQSFVGQMLTIDDTTNNIATPVMIDANSYLDPIVTIGTAWEEYTAN